MNARELAEGLAPPLVGGALSFMSGAVTNAAQAREAQKNRDFQERMSNTAHQREVKDLIAAGINPMLSARLGGSTTPGGAMAQFRDPGEGAVSTALAVRRQKAELGLIEAQTDKALSEAQAVRVGIHQSETRFPGELSLQALRTEMDTYTAEQMRMVLPLVVDKVRAEISSMHGSARAAQARALLDEYASAHAFNQKEFEEKIGALGPWGRAFMNLLRGFKEIPK